MTNEVIYVTSQTDIVRGEMALERLATNNDSRFQNPDGSITHVDLNRWEQAQQYERDTWMTHNPDATDDRNMTHSDAFDGYKSLPKDLGDVVELGCGPFTNMRFLLQKHTAASVMLVDPLINVYKTHQNCTYKDGTLYGNEVVTVNAPIEEFETGFQFDTVVMINVLHHCLDADAVLAKIRSLLNPGGYLVFHEPPREIDPLTHYDVGHPLSPTAAYLEAFLSEFTEVYRKEWYAIVRKDGGDVGEPVSEVKAHTMPAAQTTAPKKPSAPIKKAAPAKHTRRK